MILVTGAAGFVGRSLVQHLLDTRRQVRVLLPEARVRRLHRRGQPDPWTPMPEVLTGALTDEETVYRAVSDVHVIFHLENAQWWGRPRNLERVEVVGTRSLVTIARAARVGRIITLSHLGASPVSAYPLLRIKGQVEDMVRASGLAYTIIRSGVVYGPEDAFINNIAMMLGVNPLFFLMPGRGEVVLHPIYIDDLVQVLANALETVDVVDQTIAVGGAEYTTLRDLVHTVMRVTRMQRVIVPVPPYMMRWTTALYSRVLPRALVTPQWLDLLATNRTARLGSAYEHFQVRPRRLEDTLLEYLPNRRYALRAGRFALRRRPRER